MSKILDLVKEAIKEDSSVDAKVSFGNIFNHIAQKINQETGVDCKGSEIIITAYDIAHAIKGHGNHKEESDRGQIGVIPNDFEHIRTIIFEYDSVVRGRDLRNAKSLVFIKRIIIEYRIIVTVEGKIPNRKMVVKTVFKKP